MYAWWLELVGNDALLDSWQKLDSDKKKLETTEPTTHWNADSLYLSISSSHWSLGNAWPAVCADLFSEVSLSCLSIFSYWNFQGSGGQFPCCSTLRSVASVSRRHSAACAKKLCSPEAAVWICGMLLYSHSFSSILCKFVLYTNPENTVDTHGN